MTTARRPRAHAATRPSQHRGDRGRALAVVALAIGLAVAAGCSSGGGSTAKDGKNTVPVTRTPATFGKAGVQGAPVTDATGSPTTTPLTAANPDLPGDPLSYATKLFEHWKGGDQAAAALVATPAAVTAIFAKPYKSTDDWSSPNCSGVTKAGVGISTCVWTSATGTLNIQLTNTELGKNQAITKVTFGKV